MVVNKALVFAEIPDGWPEAGKHLKVEDIGFDLDAPAPEGGVTLEVHYSSFDPYMRGRMREADVKSYRAPFTLGKPMDNFSVGKILKSDARGLSAGDLVKAFVGIAQYVAVDREGMARVSKVENPHGLDERYFIGPLGMPGLTAYSSLYEIGRPRRGQTIFISAASGAVGQIVGQLAKHEGLRVVGSVGSRDKLAYIVDTLGFDAGFNYKEERPLDALRRLCPDGLDIYYENVGGEQLEAAIDVANDHARFVMCGMISQYNARPEERYPVRNLFLTVSKRLNMRGFIVTDEEFGPKWAKEHEEKLSAWIADGTFKVNISETKGIDNAATGFIGMLKGDNFGKAVLQIKGA